MQLPHFFTETRSRFFLTWSLALVVTACSQYEYTLNGHKLYSPPQLFSDFSLEDPALSSCVKQTILDKKIVAATGLTQLRCTFGGIQNTRGLEVFGELQQLDLSHNALKDIAPLARLGKLQQLNLEENPTGICVQLKTLKRQGLTLKAPQCARD